MLNQDQPGPQPGQNKELLGLMETNNVLTKFFKVKKNGIYQIVIEQEPNDSDFYLTDTIIIEEEHFNDFADALINVLQTIENELSHEFNK